MSSIGVGFKNIDKIRKENARPLELLHSFFVKGRILCWSFWLHEKNAREICENLPSAFLFHMPTLFSLHIEEMPSSRDAREESEGENKKGPYLRLIFRRHIVLNARLIRPHYVGGGGGGGRSCC